MIKTPPETRVLSNGTHIVRYPSPIGNGYLYYTDGGPEGMVLIADTHLIDISILASCIAWELDKSKENSPLSTPEDPKPIFNKQGFCF